MQKNSVMNSNHKYQPVFRLLAKLIAYWCCFSTSLILSYLLRFDFHLTSMEWRQLSDNLVIILLFKTIFLVAFRQFAGLWRFFSVQDAMNLAKALFIAHFFIISYRLFVEVSALPRSVIVMDFVLSFVFIVLLRMTMRPDVSVSTWSSFQQHGKPVLILGAGDAGAALLRNLGTAGTKGLWVVGFLDDDPAKQKASIHGVPVLGRISDIQYVVAETGARDVLIAMPRISGQRRSEIVHLLRESDVEFHTIPSVEQLAKGDVQISQLRPVQVEDLLGREPVPLNSSKICERLHGCVVMVTGAGGSIGSELCRQIAGYSPERLLLVDRSETQIFPIEQELSLGRGLPMALAIVDVRDRNAMLKLFREYRPQVLFHSAAHKHVPLMESQPAEALKNNTFVTRDLLDLAMEHGVQNFVFISTDKAIRPTSVMGATKRLAELVLQARNHNHARRGARVAVVRFGNVLGSSGSVLQIFREQLARGGPLTVTHPDMRRYFMTTSEAAGLVLQSAAQMKGGEVFVLDMGKPVHIHALAASLIELSGLRQGVDIEIQITRPRPGEKLFEELSYGSEVFLETEHPRIMQFNGNSEPPPGFLDDLATLENRLHEMSPEKIKLAIRTLVPEYTPYGIGAEQ